MIFVFVFPIDLICPRRTTTDFVFFSSYKSDVNKKRKERKTVEMKLTLFRRAILLSRLRV